MLWLYHPDSSAANACLEAILLRAIFVDGKRLEHKKARGAIRVPQRRALLMRARAAEAPARRELPHLGVEEPV